MTTDIATKHEIVELFDKYQLTLSDTLVEMLNEDYTHQTERRGCGYTQATRALSTHINATRDPIDFGDLRIFNHSLRSLKIVMNQASNEDIDLITWRNLDLRTDLIKLLNDPQKTASNPNFFAALNTELSFQHNLRHMSERLKLEESILLVNILTDIILPYHGDELSNLTALPDKPKVGSCTMAEKFFLEIAYNAIPRKGRVNVIVDQNRQPLLIEKLNMGDSHSCISVAPVCMNGVRLPIGSLFAVEYAPDLDTKQPCKRIRGQIIPLSLCTGFRFLRLTTLSVSPANRSRAFTAHYKSQAAAGLFSYHSTEISQLLAIAKAQL